MSVSSGAREQQGATVTRAGTRYRTYYRKVVHSEVRDVLVSVPGVFHGYDARFVCKLDCGHERVTGYTRPRNQRTLWCTECCKLKLNGKAY